MKRIIKDISPRYLRNEKEFVKRISQIVAGSTEWEPWEKSDGYHWQIDRGNDWWCTLNSDGTLEIAYRYDDGGNTEWVDAVIKFLESTCTGGKDFL